MDDKNVIDVHTFTPSNGWYPDFINVVSSSTEGVSPGDLISRCYGNNYTSPGFFQLGLVLSVTEKNRKKTVIVLWEAV